MIADVSPADVDKAIVAYLEGTPIAVERADSGPDFDIVVQVFAGDGAEGAAAAAEGAVARPGAADAGAPARRALVRIADFHTDIRRGRSATARCCACAAPSLPRAGEAEGMTDRGVPSPWPHLELRHDGGPDDVRGLLERQVASPAVADEGLRRRMGRQHRRRMLSPTATA
ncbi:MAG: hypothetical protein V8S24_01250 [Gordonibacter pamelaeae]